MKFKLVLSQEATRQFKELEANSAKLKLFKKICKTLGLLETNLKHPSLHTHEYQSIDSPFGGKVFEAYVENKTPGAYRVFWCYGPNKTQITILAITPHP